MLAFVIATGFSGSAGTAGGSEREVARTLEYRPNGERVGDDSFKTSTNEAHGKRQLRGSVWGDSRRDGRLRVLPRPRSETLRSTEGGDARAHSRQPIREQRSESPGRVTRRACPDHRRGLAYYRHRQQHWLSKRSGALKIVFKGRRPRSCPDARYLAVVARGRARAARTLTERWVARHVLRDFEVQPGNRAWLRATWEVQKLYPGTHGWLLSCSKAEGGWGRFVVHGGGSYYYGAETAKSGREVFGPMQYTFGTFRDHSWNARRDAAARGFIVPASAGSWHSALAQALAAGWAKFYDRDYRHWEASWETGCWP